MTPIFAFGTIWDHACIEQTSKYFNGHLAVYYQRQTQFDFIQHYISHNNADFDLQNVPVIDENIAHWLTAHLINIKELRINVEIDEKILMLLLKNKTKLKYLNISPLSHHNKISHGFILKLNELCPSIDKIKMIGCNWNLSSFNQYQLFQSLLKKVERKNDFILQRLPDWFHGDWICYQDNAIQCGEIHNYQINGLFRYKRAIQHTACVTHVEYVENYNLFSKEPTLKLKYWIPGWPVAFFGHVSLIMRPYTLNKNQLKEINDNDQLQCSIIKEYGDKLTKTKYHFEAMEFAQNTQSDPGGILNQWPDDILSVRHYGIWIKIVFHE